MPEPAVFRAALLWPCAVSLCLASAACTLRDDTTQANQLESLRVMGIASEPADLVVGETASLSALVYAPPAQGTPSYQWSWCISRGSAEEGLACTIAEEDLRAAWDGLNTGVDLPAYDLGTEETASFPLVFETSQALDICTALSIGEDNFEFALFNCLSGLALSIELRVRTDSEELVAIKEIPIVEDGAERNQNPAIGSALLRELRGGGALDEDAPLRREAVYDLTIEVEPEASEVFLPEEEEGLPPPEPRSESLFLSWFVSQGATHRKGEQRTFFHDSGDFEDLLENTWEMPFDDEGDLAELFLVLRDERGGIGFQQFSFAVQGAE